MRLFGKILLLFALFVAGNVSAATRSDTIKIASLLHRISRTEVVRTLGGPAVISDSMVDAVKGGLHTTLIFEPILFEGIPALIEVQLLHDTTSKLSIFLPYIGHAETRLKVPFTMPDFVRGTLEEYNQIERKVEDELGIPTVLTGTTFEYLDGNTQPIFGVFSQGEVQITIVPK